jgi:hypothetical protein
MHNNSHIQEIRERYIKLTKAFFRELDNGKDISELQPLQDEIEKTLLELDALEKNDATSPN